MKKIITILALGLASILHAEDPLAFRNDSAAVANDISFSHLSVFLEGGELLRPLRVRPRCRRAPYGGWFT